MFAVIVIVVLVYLTGICRGGSNERQGNGEALGDGEGDGAGVVAVIAPEVPLTVTVTGPPNVAVALAVRVSMLVFAVVGLGLNEAVTPLGRPVAASVTFPVNPNVSVTVMLLVPPVAPCVIVRVLGEAASVKPGTGAVTCSAKVCVLAAGAPVVFAESVTVVFPTGVVPVAVTVKVTVTGVDEVGLTDADGEKAHAAPVGRPLGQLSATEPAKEPEAETTNVL